MSINFKFFIIVNTLFLMLFAFSCEKSSKSVSIQEKELSSSDESIHVRGKELYGQICASCHGLSGKGDGPAARALVIKPRNYQEGFKAGNDVESIKDTIANGYLGGKTGMVGWKSSFETEEDLESVARYVRKLAGLK